MNLMARSMRLEDVCEPHVEVVDPRRRPDQRFWYVNISAVDNTVKRITRPKQMFGSEAPSRAKQLIRKDDVIIATTRPNLNAVALVPPEFDEAVCSTGFCVLRAKPQVADPYFLFLWVQSARFVECLSALVKGAMYPAVTDRQVLAQGIAVPSLQEQRRVVARLRGQMAEVERLRAAAEKQRAALRALRAAEIRDAFDGAEAARRPRRALGELCDGPGRYGTSERAASEPTGLAVLRMGNIRNGMIDWSGLKYVDLPAAEAAKYRLADGDILFNRTNSAELVGKAAVYDAHREAVFASYLVRFRVRRGLADPRFVCCFINSPAGRTFIQANMARAIGQVNISASTMARMPVPCPPLDEQRRIVGALEACTARVDALLSTASVQDAAVGSLQRALLDAAFGGAGPLACAAAEG